MPIHLLPNRAGDPGPTRREFLAGLGVAGAAMAAGRLGWAADEAAKAGSWYAMVSDTHIAADPSARSRGQVMADNLRAVIADILQRADRPAGVIVSGDLALNDGQLGDYRTLLGLIEPLRQAGIPIHLTLGNHDARDHFREILARLVPPETAVVDKQVSVVEGPGLRFVLLDSLDKVNVTPGLLGERQLRWLADQLDANRDATTLVVVHHDLGPTKNALRDASALLDVLRPRRQVKALFYGHTHVWDLKDDAGLHRVNLPAVAYPFAKDQPLGWCPLRVAPDGAQIELRCVGGDRHLDRQTTTLRWRADKA